MLFELVVVSIRQNWFVNLLFHSMLLFYDNSESGKSGLKRLTD